MLLIAIGLCCNGIGYGQESPRVTVETATDEVVGRLEQLSDQRGVRLSGDTNARLQPAEVLTVRFEDADQPAEGPGMVGKVALANGSRFAYVSVEFLDERLRFVLPGDAEIESPIADITEWYLTADGDGRLGGTDPGKAADVLFVRRPQGETVPVSGVILGLDAAGVRFALGTDDTTNPVVAPWERLVGIRFYRGRSDDPPAEKVVVGLRDGSRLVAESVSYDQGRLAWRSGADGGECPVASVASIQLSAGRVVPVRRLELVSQRWQPFFEGATTKGHAFDRSLAGAPLALRWPDRRAPAAWPEVHTVRPYLGGVAIRSESELRFTLPEGSRRLKGVVGLDPETAGVGSAQVSILADNQPVWSGVIDGGTRPVELNLELPAARVLSIRVGYGDNLDAGDNVHFAELRVVR